MSEPFDEVRRARRSNRATLSNFNLAVPTPLKDGEVTGAEDTQAGSSGVTPAAISISKALMTWITDR